MGRVARSSRIALARGLRRIAGRLFIRRPVPFRAVLALRALAGVRDGILPEWAAEAHAMSDVDLEFLADYLRRAKPSTVLEFGCGNSTIRMARVLADLHRDGDVHLCSVEQDAQFAEECLRRLAVEGLNAAVATCRLVTQPAPNGGTQSYDLAPEFLAALLQDRVPDLILIDGPSGGRFARFPVLPRVRPLLAADTPFLLHDGLRDYELLRVAKAWQTIPGIEVEGVYVGGEGFLVGTVAPG